ncbi:MAG TPA: hypothetical protein PK447_10070, partial [Ignavibacteria bacterium]|nr:hypothetical protein [Ignavibacteria bacterium]
NIENTTMKNLQGKTINPDFKNISETDINKTEHNYFEYERIRFKEQALPVGFPEYLHKLFDMKKSFDLEKNPLTHRISFYGYVYENRLNPKYRNIDIYNKDIMENEFVKFNAAYKQYKPTMKKKKGE